MRTKVIAIFCLLLVTLSCSKDKPPTVITTPISELTWDFAIGGGEVIDDGGSPVTSRGLCITTNSIDPPTILDRSDSWHTNDGSGLGSFSSTVNLVWAGAGHTIRQNHYIRAYATNSAGTAYGDIIDLFPKSKPPVFNSISLISLRTTSAIISFVIKVPSETFTVDKVAICVSSNPNPSIEGTHFQISLDRLSENFTILDLTPNTAYFVRGYVENESGFAYSPEISFTTWEGELADIDGNLYPFKTIGSQVWMTENLRASKFNDGSIIPNIQDNLEWGSTNTSATCTYNTYGKLYNYFAIVDNRNLCPAGWHVPSDSEWKALELNLGMSQDQVDATGYRGTDEGGKLKISLLDIDIWKVPNTGATNHSGFSAPGSGFRYENGIMTNITVSANFWSSSEFDIDAAWSRSLSYNSAQIGRMSINKKYGFSVRCVKD